MTNEKPTPDVAAALQSTLISPNESDSNLEPANVVDGLFAIARAIDHLADTIQSERKPAKAQARQAADPHPRPSTQW